jgi:hypothetical protein
MISILASAAIFITWICSSVISLHYLIPIVLVVFGVIFIAIIAVVLTFSWKDPSKLMLGQITGREYAVIQRLTLGDSNAGEHIDNLVIGVSEIIDPDTSLPKLPEASSEPKRSDASAGGSNNVG